MEKDEENLGGGADSLNVRYPALESPCDLCNGEGGRRCGGEWFVCQQSNGKRLLPTEFGLQVIEFLLRNANMLKGQI